jgi:hypothetical protein
MMRTRPFSRQQVQRGNGVITSEEVLGNVRYDA